MNLVGFILEFSSGSTHHVCPLAIDPHQSLIIPWGGYGHGGGTPGKNLVVIPIPDSPFPQYPTIGSCYKSNMIFQGEAMSL